MGYGASLRIDETGKCPRLVYVAEHGQWDMVKLLVDSGYDVNSVGTSRGDECGCLVHAANQGNVEMVKYFLEHGAKYDICEYYEDDDDYKVWDYSQNPLACALRKGHLNAARLLLDHGAHASLTMVPDLWDSDCIDGVNFLLETVDCDTQNLDDGTTTMLGHAAAACGSTSILESLLKNGWDINSIIKVDDSCFNLTPLTWASRYNQEEAARFLLSQGADPMGTPTLSGQLVGHMAPLQMAATHGHEGIIQLLLENNAKLEHDDENPEDTIWMSGRINKRTFQVFLKHNVPLDPYTWDFVCNTRPEYMQMILDAGYKIMEPPLVGENNELLGIVGNCEKEALDVYIQNGFNPRPNNNQHEKEVLLDATRNVNINLLRFLQSQGFNLRRPEWQAELLQAAVLGPRYSGGPKAEILDFLLTEGLSLEAQDKNYATPLLMIASRRSDITEIPAVQTLLACGANPFFVSPSGDSPLIAAVKHLGMMKEEIVSALLESIAQRKEKYPLSLLEPIILRAIGIISEAEDVAARRQNISPELLKLMCEKIMGINLRAEDGSARHQDIPPESIEWVVATIRAINDPAGDEYPQPPFIPLEEIDYTVARARGTDNPAGDPPWLLPFIPIDAIQLVIGEVMENHKPLDPAGDRTARHLWSVKKLITQFYWRLKYPVPT